jgi:CHRD domain
MRSKLLASTSATAVVLAVAACGSSSSTSSSGSGKKHAHAPIRIYRPKLTGSAETPPGAPRGGGEAVIALHGSSKVCWRFVRLKGFTGATFAHIHRAPSGKAGNIVVPLSTGTKLHHKGCVSAAGAVIRAIEKDPAGYYVNIHSRKYPGGAVRAQL